jgi:hypothetical protein
MTAYQLSLFSDKKPTVLKAKKMKTKQTQPHLPKSTIIEQCCSTKRAAALLDISNSTLYRYRQQGKIYRKGAWIAKPIDQKNWTVFYS